LQLVVLPSGVAHPVPVLPQSANPAAHVYEHFPVAQASPVTLTCGSAEHATPQPPQLVTSVPVTSTQVPEQFVVPAVHTHAPASHVWLEPQAVHDAPHAIGSVAVLTQLPEQRASPAAHPHTPPSHDWPPEQAFWQFPQWALSVFTLVQVVPQ
jgi:hypothetical protein